MGAQNAIVAPQKSWNKPYKLHIGCGRQRLQGYINCDLYETAATDQVFDATGIWPFEDNSVGTIYISHTLEHLENFRQFFREAHRVLIPHGTLQVRVPFGNHHAAWWDITHVRPWFAENFCFLQPCYEQSVGNAQHATWDKFFSVNDVMLRLSGRIVPLLRWKLMRTLLCPWLDCLNNVVEELWVYLVALKDQASIDQWLQARSPNAVPGRYVAYRHHFEGRPLGAHEATDFVTLANGRWYNGFHAWKTGAQ